MIYDCVIVGGGIAGLQAAIQLGRYKHKVLVIDSNNGRSSLCRAYHNLLGWPNGISGRELRDRGMHHAGQLGVEFQINRIIAAEKQDTRFVLTGEDETLYFGERLLIATGIMDRIPNFSALYPCLGISVYVCPDCDGYEVKDRPAIVIGSGTVGANMALTLTYWTDQLIYINHEQSEVDQQLLKKMDDKNIQYYNEKIKEVLADGPQIKAVILQNGLKIMGDHAFIAFGGNEVRSKLTEKLGVILHENKHILTDPRTKMTNIENVWAAGDVVAHSEQVTIAMGEGSQAAIWIHKSLMETH